VCDLDVGLEKGEQSTSVQTRNTYPNVVIQVIADRQVNPLIGGDHSCTINRGALDNVQLISRANSTCAG
jgi:hypothetical protein